MDWQTERLIDWVIDRLIDWLTDWFNDWLTNWVTVWSTNELTDWSTNELTDWLTVWLTNDAAHLPIKQTYFCTNRWLTLLVLSNGHKKVGGRARHDEDTCTQILHEALRNVGNRITARGGLPTKRTHYVALVIIYYV